MDIGVAFQAEQLRHLHRADLAGAAQVVAQQIDDHQVFGAVLLACQQFHTVAGILGGIGATWPGAFDGAGFDLAGADLDKTLRRKAQQCAAVSQQLEARVGRGAGLA
ncbi:hypothetical protein D3C77_524370 [compost metagenome]